MLAAHLTYSNGAVQIRVGLEGFGARRRMAKVDLLGRGGAF